MSDIDILNKLSKLIGQDCSGGVKVTPLNSRDEKCSTFLYTTCTTPPEAGALSLSCGEKETISYIGVVDGKKTCVTKTWECVCEGKNRDIIIENVT